MVIVSQDKRTIINFENIKTIELDRETNFTSINIFRETNQTETGVCGLYIGHYKTEERAKEVLEEIQTVYATSKILKLPSVAPEEKISAPDLMEAFVYKMPED